jgi:hypothetical protein
MGAAILESLGSLQAGAQLVREILAIYRERKAAQGGGPDELEQKLEQAAQQLKLAEVAAARDFGIPICKRHWLPGIMLDESPPDHKGSRFRCPVCDHIEERHFVGAVAKPARDPW